jgi:hypothetical protein
LILALVDPREVAAGVHQPHQEEPGFAAGPVDVDQHLEEVDLGEIAWPIRQRHEDLAPLPLPLRDGVFDHRDAHGVPFRPEHRVQARGRQPLFTAGPADGLGQQRLHAGPDRLPDRPRPRRRLRRPRRSRLVQVLADRDPRQSQLPCHRPLRSPFDQHFVPDHVYLIHPEHPPANPGSPDPASPH